MSDDERLLENALRLNFKEAVKRAVAEGRIIHVTKKDLERGPDSINRPGAQPAPVGGFVGPRSKLRFNRDW